MKIRAKAFRNIIYSLIAICILTGLAGILLLQKSAVKNSDGRVPFCGESPLEYIEVLC